MTTRDTPSLKPNCPKNPSSGNDELSFLKLSPNKNLLRKNTSEPGGCESPGHGLRMEAVNSSRRMGEHLHRHDVQFVTRPRRN